MAANSVPSFADASALWTDEDFAAINYELRYMGGTELVAAFSRLPLSVLQRIVRENKYAAFHVSRPSIIADQHKIALKRADDQACASAKARFLAVAGPKFACFGDRLHVDVKIDREGADGTRKTVETYLKITLGDRNVADVVSQLKQARDERADLSFVRFATDFPCGGAGGPTPQEWNDAICMFFGSEPETETPSKKRKRTE